MNANEHEPTSNTQMVTCLLHAIADTQATIRSYDTKAQISGVFLTLLVGVINLHAPKYTSATASFSSWLATLLALIGASVLGFVLFPRKNPWKDVQLGDYAPKLAYYIPNPEAQPENSLAAVTERARSTDWGQELSYELLKLSCIRNVKHGWFRIGSIAGGLSVLTAIIFVVAGRYCG